MYKKCICKKDFKFDGGTYKSLMRFDFIESNIYYYNFEDLGAYIITYIYERKKFNILLACIVLNEFNEYFIDFSEFREQRINSILNGR